MTTNPFLIINDNVLKMDETSVLHQNRGFLYGDGFFESMRCENGRLLFENLHWERIKRSCQLLEIDSTKIPNKEQLRWQIESLIMQNKMHGAVRARLSIYRKSEGPYLPEENNPGYMLQVNPIVLNQAQKEKGLKAGIYSVQPKAEGAYSCIKSLSSLLYVMAGIYAKKHKLDEAILVNSKGNYVEGISCNLFVVNKDTVLTPPLSEGCIDGVFRTFMIQTLMENDIPFREQPITDFELTLASEIWLTNVAKGLQWVKQINKQVYDNKLAKKIEKMLFRKINSVAF